MRFLDQIFSSPRGRLLKAAVAASDSVADIARMLDEGTDVNSRRVDGATALMLAAEAGRDEVVRLLLSRNTDPNLKRKVGVTALVLAAHRKHVEAVLLLLRANVSTFVEGVGGEGQKLTIDDKWFVQRLAEALDLAAAPIWGTTAIALRNVTRQLLLLQRLGEVQYDKVQSMFSTFQICEERLRTGTAPKEAETGHESSVMLNQLSDQISRDCSGQPVGMRIELMRISLMLSVGSGTIEAILVPDLRKGDSKIWGDALDSGRAGFEETCVYMMDFTFEYFCAQGKEVVHGGLFHLGCIWQDMCRLKELMAERGLDRQSPFEPAWLGSLWPEGTPAWMQLQP